LDKSTYLGETEVARLLWRFSVPAVFGVLVNAFYNVVDSIGRLDQRTVIMDGFLRSLIKL